jgi:hypothetical protein
MIDLLQCIEASGYRAFHKHSASLDSIPATRTKFVATVGLHSLLVLMMMMSNMSKGALKKLSLYSDIVRPQAPGSPIEVPVV